MGCITSTQKNHIKKMFLQAFKDLNEDLLRYAITNLLDYDKSHNTRKFEKYLMKGIIQEKKEGKEDGKIMVEKIMGNMFNFDEPEILSQPQNQVKHVEEKIQKNDIVKTTLLSIIDDLNKDIKDKKKIIEDKNSLINHKEKEISLMNDGILDKKKNETILELRVNQLKDDINHLQNNIKALTEKRDEEKKKLDKQIAEDKLLTEKLKIAKRNKILLTHKFNEQDIKRKKIGKMG